MKGIKKALLFRKHDIYIYTILALLCVFLFLGTQKFYSKGQAAFVYSNGELVKILPLNKNAEFKAEGGGGYNLVVVENGSAYIKEADCPDGICKKSGKISKAGQSIICVPHKLKIEIKAKAEQVFSFIGGLLFKAGKL